MDSETTVVGECGSFSLLLCEVDLAEEASEEVMVMEQASLLLSLTMIMVVMYFSRLLTATLMQLLSLHLLLTATLMQYKQVSTLLVLRYNQQVTQQVFQDNRLLMLFSQVMLQQLLSQLLAAAMLKVQSQLRVMRIDLQQQIRQQLLLENLMRKLL